MYPYDFELYITYRLDGKNIFVDWKVKNPSEETIYFTIGAHPAFMFEGAKETKDDYLPVSYTHLDVYKRQLGRR